MNLFTIAFFFWYNLLCNLYLDLSDLNIYYVLFFQILEFHFSQLEVNLHLERIFGTSRNLFYSDPFLQTQTRGPLESLIFTVIFLVIFDTKEDDFCPDEI